MLRRFLYTYLFSLLALISLSQEGNFYITNFTPSAYGASDQNWSVTQDSLGRVFVANLNGVMMYDGKYWKIIALDGDREATSLAKADNGTIYVGASGEFGFLSFSSITGWFCFRWRFILEFGLAQAMNSLPSFLPCKV